MTGRFLALTLVAGCAVRAAPLPPDHPANPRAPVGRLAEPPAALRPGAAAHGDPPSAPAEPAPPAHHHH